MQSTRTDLDDTVLDGVAGLKHITVLGALVADHDLFHDRQKGVQLAVPASSGCADLLQLDILEVLLETHERLACTVTSPQMT